MWNRDIDKCVTVAMIEELATRTATPTRRALRTRLGEFEGKLYERHNPNGNTPWIMPLGVYHRTRRRYGLQFCPRCLDEPEPYYRRAWRLAFVTLCERHRCPLLDRCPACERPVNFHRHDLGKRDSPCAGLLTSCYACGLDFRRAGSSRVRVEASDVRTQAMLMNAADSGRIRLPSGRAVRSSLYFPVLHQLIKTVALGRRASRVRRGISQASGLEYFDPFPHQKRLYVEDLGLPERRATLRMCIWLLGRWPRRFTKFCADNGIWESWILKDFATAPRWFYDEVHRNLYRPLPALLGRNPRRSE